MEFESWWLLVVPLSFGLGWFAARLDRRSARAASRALPDAYFRGLNFLLNEQPDKAIDAFVDVVRIEPETLELHFALGNLFRRRGETDRAIRVHKNLVERAIIDPAQRENALFELGQDYLKAGLLDRAEDAFHRLSDSAHAPQALRLRLEMAQMVRDWPQAIELATRLQEHAEDRETQSRNLAHFHCEIAAQALADDAPDRLERARRAIESAAACAPEHPRPAVLAGEVALAAGQAREALSAWQSVQRHRPEYLALVAAGWLQAHEACGTLAQGIADLKSIHEAQASADTLVAIAHAIERLEGSRAAQDWVEAEVRRHPSLLGLQTLIELRLPEAREEHLRELELTRTLIKPQVARLSRYGCLQCGFKARQFHWQCPGCGSWDRYPPRRSEELER